MPRKTLATILLLFSFVAAFIVIVELFSGFIIRIDTVPIFGWVSTVTYMIFWIVIPMIGSILVILIVPRILTPLFMLIKKSLNRGYNDGYIDIEMNPLRGKKIGTRLLYLYLLIVALSVIFSSLFDPLEFLPVGTTGFDLRYHIAFIWCMMSIATPIAVSLWSVSWAMEDASLIHYKIPSKEEGELYEIEPVYKTYSSYLKGFAGLSTLFSLVVIFNYLMDVNQVFSAISVFLVPFNGALNAIPAYFIYAMIGSKWLRKNKRGVKYLSESDLDLYTE
ncbi:MAG: hypothetical protein JW779_14865 [Candidatus Thorarchaeota archaeon]|nr:hypothetical protein [Candidatus Thorarchaeota archaeon]